MRESTAEEVQCSLSVWQCNKKGKGVEDGETGPGTGAR